MTMTQFVNISGIAVRVETLNEPMEASAQTSLKTQH